jgi:hypothetical protein
VKWDALKLKGGHITHHSEIERLAVCLDLLNHQGTRGAQITMTVIAKN